MQTLNCLMMRLIIKISFLYKSSVISITYLYYMSLMLNIPSISYFSRAFPVRPDHKCCQLTFAVVFIVVVAVVS